MNQHSLLTLIIILFLAGCKASQAPTATTPEPVVTADTVAQPAEEVVAVAVEPEYPYQPAQTRLFDLIHTRLEVRPEWEQHHLQGKATLEIKPYFYPQSQVVLDAQGFDIHSVSLLNNNQTEPLQYQYDGQKLTIDLDKTYSRNEHFFVQIDYTAKPDELPTGGSAAITQDKGLYFIDGDSTVFGKKMQQLWTQGETQANSRWFPTFDQPNERSTQEMYITVDDRFITLSNGLLVSSQMENDSTRTDYWRMDKPHAPYLFMMAISEFAQVEDQWQGMPVNYYVKPEYEPYAQDIFGHTPEMLTFFSDKLGVRYPWPKYSQIVVDDFVSGAMENTSASIFYDALLVDDRTLLDLNWDGIIAHELFHHWFGDLVTTESWANLTLNEGFASYSEYLWNEYKYGSDAAAYGLWEQGQNYFSEAEQKQVPLIRYHYADREDMFDRHSYDKGSRVLHMLRHYVGDEAFFAALKKYLQDHAYQSVEVNDLRLAFEAVTGEDLNWFFNQWFLSPGHPELLIEQSYDSGQVILEITQTQDTLTTPVYTLPAYVDVWTGGEKKRYAVEIEETNSTLTFPTAQQPDLVLFDADAQLLAQVAHEKSREELIYQFTHADAFVPQYESLMALSADSVNDNKEVFVNALNNDFWIIRQLGLNLLEGKVAADGQAVVEKVTALAQNDPKSLVRADAITLLASLNLNQYQDLFKTALQDSSYAVVGSAIAAYAQTDAQDKSALFAPYAQYNNFNTVMALADYYLSQQDATQYDWFREKIAAADAQTTYYLLNYFARYLSMLPTDQQQAGIDLLAKYALDHPQYYVRMSAYRSLAFFDELPGVTQKRQQIKAAEKDERLKQMYEQIP